MNQPTDRVFLFLQGPHGPFFRRLARRMAARGCAVRRLAFNASDEAEWRRAGPLDRFVGPIEDYAAWLGNYLTRHGVTDIVLYGDSRPEHSRAVDLAHARGLRCHCFEEGYLRPHCVTYERGGNNGNSPLNRIGLDRIATALGLSGPPTERPSDRWGSLGTHLWYSLLYYLRLTLPSRLYGRYRSRREIGLWHELAMYIGRFATIPLRRARQARWIRRLRRDATPYHLVLLQLSFDSAMQYHSSYRRSADFIADCVAGFAEGAAPGEKLVFKAHPLEDGRERLCRVIAREAALHGVGDRVLFLDGGKGLAQLLQSARSVVTINSTAAQPALALGLPVAALGQAVYVRPGLTSGAPLNAFFANPRPPRQRLYWLFRRFLAETSQKRGSFYSPAGIAELLGSLPDAMLAPLDPYEARFAACGMALPTAPIEAQGPLQASARAPAQAGRADPPLRRRAAG